MKKENKKKVTILTIIAVVVLLLVVVGATYAYFQAQGGGSGNTDVNVQTATTDNLSFQIGGSISITANQEDFGSGMPNKSGSTTASATLTANNATNNATRNYYVYLDITSNDFEYTTADNQAELLLKVTDPDGTEVTNISGLTRKTSGDVTGFDITTQTGLITIADNYEITSTGTVTQEWQIEVIFANLDSDQNANTGKTFSANLIIQEEKILTSIADVCPDGGNLADCVVLLNTTAKDSKYTGLYHHDADLANGAGDNSYRYSGANPNNYVCFGATGADCQNPENQYRIIGVLNNQVKLIKATSYGDYVWDTDGVNTWDASTKPDIYTTLNETYYNTLGNEWQNLIEETTWQVGGVSNPIFSSSFKTFYDYEVGEYQTGYEEMMKIGLMYVTDYVYASPAEDWGTTVFGYAYVEGSDPLENWLYLGSTDYWTITPNSSTSNSVFACVQHGYLNNRRVSSGYSARPVFYLESNVQLERGSGTSSDPYRLSVN